MKNLLPFLMLLLSCTLAFAQGTASTSDVVVKVTYADGTPASVSVRAAYKSPGGDKIAGTAQQVRVGWYTLAAIPEDITALSVIARVDDGNSPALFRKQWTFTQPAVSRTLEMTVERGTPVRLRVVNAAGKPLAHATVRGVLFSTQQPLWDDAFWRTTLPNIPSSHGITKTTNEHGDAQLGRWPARNYTIKLFANGISGEPISLQLPPDKKEQVVTFRAILPPRVVTQRVVGANGHAIPGAAVKASYYWKMKFHLISASANARGIVRWPELPPVPVIVWGTGIPAGVITPDMRKVTGPLPSPPHNGNLFFTISLENTGVQNAEDMQVFLTTARAAGKRISRLTDIQFVESNRSAPVRQPKIFNQRMLSGLPYDVVGVTTAWPPRIAAWVDVYVPYMELSTQWAAFTLPFHDAPTLTGHVVTPDGQPAGAGTRVNVIPLKVDAPLPYYLLQDSKDRPVIFAPTVDTDGAFRLPLLAVGCYRIEAAGVQSDVEIKAGNNEVKLVVHGETVE